MEAFLELFGSYTILGITVYKWFLIGGAAFFVYKKFISKLFRKIRTVYELHVEKERVLQKALEQVNLYPEWRNQSIEAQNRFDTAIEAINTKIDEIGVSVNTLSIVSGEGMAYTWRYRILRFDDEIRHDEKHTKEHFDQILEDIKSYENYCDLHPDFPNNKVEFAVMNIKRVYQKCTEEGTFL